MLAPHSQACDGSAARIGTSGRCVLSLSNRATSAPVATKKSSACVPRISRRGRRRCAASSSAARPKAGRCSRSSRPPTACSTPHAAHRAQRPIVLMQGGIHAGEIDGKDAGFLALREMLDGQGRARARSTQVTFVFVPVFNVDGHERFGRWNRPNQVGPEEMGWRTTAQNFNLNRDYIKADAPEMQAMLRLLNEWDPILYVDLHVTDGAQFEHDVSIQRRADATPATTTLRRSGSRRARRAHAAHARRRARCRSTSIRRSCATTIPRRASRSPVGAEALFAGVLGRAQSHRRAGRDAFVEGLPDARAHHAQLDRRDDGDGGARRRASGCEAREGRRRALARVGGTSVALTYENTPHVAHHRVPRLRVHARAFGDLRRADDALRPEEAADLAHPARPTKCARRSTVTAPRGGYIVPAAYAQMVGEKLALHGIEFRKLTSAQRRHRCGGVPCDEGHAGAAHVRRSHAARRSKVSGRASGATCPRARCSCRSRRRARCLLMTLLEPKNPDSLVSWGLFNTAFERKEYMEAYVAEDVARADAEERSGAAAGIREAAERGRRRSRAIRMRGSNSSIAAIRRGTSATTCIRCIGWTRRRTGIESSPARSPWSAASRAARGPCRRATRGSARRARACNHRALR